MGKIKHLKSLPILPNVNGNKDERRKRIRNITDPLEDQDAATKKWVSDNFT